jgi:hypothetical protein
MKKEVGVDGLVHHWGRAPVHCIKFVLIFHVNSRKYVLAMQGVTISD